MTTTLRQAAQAAFDELGEVLDWNKHEKAALRDQELRSIRACREKLGAALAAPADALAGPVATYRGCGAEEEHDLLIELEGLTIGTKLYAAPPEPVAPSAVVAWRMINGDLKTDWYDGTPDVQLREDMRTNAPHVKFEYAHSAPPATQLSQAVERAIAEERERCAVICEKAIDSIWEYHEENHKRTGRNVCTNLAAAIRRGKEGGHA